ncbi:MAG: hypothetical protein DCC71_05670 [Proteobacteria bacterium]|nr:MAG: hypothetical protein DCC71_05670 [Pseudomonadota bacterium]
MKVWRYSRWDGTQQPFSLDAKQALDALADLLMEGLGAEEALAWMQRAGFELAGLDMRVMGVEELLEELRQRVRELEQRYRLDGATDALRRRLDEILAREERAQRERHGYESRRMNDFLDRRDALRPAGEGAEEGGARELSDAIERFRDWDFADAAAGEDFRALLDELDRLRALERFARERGARFRGGERADYETAQGIREQIEALERLARDLAAGRFEPIDPAELAELLSENALRSLVLIRDLRASLERAGFLRDRDGAPELTPRAIRRIGAQALATVYGALRKGRPGAHETVQQGIASARPDETRPWQFGDAFDVDVLKSLLNAVKRRAASAPASNGISWTEADLEVREKDFHTQCTSVLLLDMSWSMSWAGRFPAAKRVAIALDHLIRTRWPRDHFFVVGFSTRARELRVQELPEASWDMGEPFTNLQEGLMLAERLIARHPSPSAQVLVITDGQPTAYFRGRELHVEWPMGFGGVSPHAAAETLKQVRRITRRGVTINTFMLDAAPELVSFVEQMTRINKGRALYTQPSQLGSYVMVDYLAHKRTLRK